MLDWVSELLLADDSEDVGFGDDEVLFAVDFDFGAAVFGDEDHVVHLDGEGCWLTVVVFAAGAEGDDFCLLGLFFSGVGDVESAGGFFIAVDALDENALSEWLDFSHVFVFGCVLLGPGGR